MSRTFRKESYRQERLLKPRNPFACDPLLSKGGAHSKSKAKERQAGDRFIESELSDVVEPEDDDV